MDASSVTSSAAVRHPAASSSVSVDGSRAVAQVVCPARTSASAVARPMPEEQPVTSAVLVMARTLPQVAQRAQDLDRDGEVREAGVGAGQLRALVRVGHADALAAGGQAGLDARGGVLD